MKKEKNDGQKFIATWLKDKEKEFSELAEMYPEFQEWYIIRQEASSDALRTLEKHWNTEKAPN